MNVEDHIWNLATKKLVNEASAAELEELDKLLHQYPVIGHDIKQLFTWWHYDDEQDIIDRGEILFNRIKEKIKHAEKQAQQNKQP